MYKFISSFFKKHEKVTLNFFSDSKNIVKISIQHNTHNSEFISSVIYALNSGLFLDKIINALLDKNEPITNNVLQKLDMLYSIDHQNNLMIQPLEVFDKNVK